jgi:hypothetical protein
MALSPEDRADIDRMVRERLIDIERDLRRELTASSIRQAIDRAPTVRAMPCIVQSVGVTVDGTLFNSLGTVLADDSPDGLPIIATMLGTGWAAGSRGVILFIPPGGVYVAGPIVA